MNISDGLGLNANHGYVKFSDHENWAAVPNGSFITFYQYPDLVKLEDPTDVNNDGIYVVGISLETNEINEFVDVYSSFWDVQHHDDKFHLDFEFDGHHLNLSLNFL